MARRKGFFAEIQRAAAAAERERKRQQAAAYRESERLQREAERALASQQRFQMAAQRADAREHAVAVRNAEKARLLSRQAEAAARTAVAQSFVSEIDEVLQATLAVDDYVDLEALRATAVHPEFESRYPLPEPPPVPTAVPPEPTFSAPPPPSGAAALFGKRKHAEAVTAAQERFAQEHAQWRAYAASVPARQLQQLREYELREAGRLRALEADRFNYDAECAKRDEEVLAQNAEVDELIASLARGEAAAVEEYVGIILGKSAYPEGLDVTEDYAFDGDSRELELALHLPLPDLFPSVKEYRYNKSQDEIVEVLRSAKEQKDRYQRFVENVVLRSLHEVFEADRKGTIRTISLTADIAHVDPARGSDTVTIIVAVGVHRDDFEGLDLARVTPSETLRHLNAVVSKNAHGLVPIDLTRGARS